MKRIFTYIFIVLFLIGSLQAGTHYCVNMDMPIDGQDVPDTSMSDDQGSCHLPSEEPLNDNQDKSCCDDGCESCVSVGVTFNSSTDNLEFAYIESYKQYGSFFILSNHIKIPTPPPNS